MNLHNIGGRCQSFVSQSRQPGRAISLILHSGIQQSIRDHVTRIPISRRIAHGSAIGAHQKEGESIVEKLPEASHAVPEAVLDMDNSQQEQQEEILYTEIEVTTETEVEIEIKSFREQAQSFLTATTLGNAMLVVGAGLLALTLGIAVKRVYEKANTPEAKRLRQIDHNKNLAVELNKFLPDKRDKLNAGVIGGIKRSTGFSNVEIFRKYLWYLLRERKFDSAAVEDMVALKVAAGLTDDEVAEALAERSQRIYDKYGTMMLNTEGFSASGLERKATCKSLFQKMQYLTEHEPLIKPGTEAAGKVNLRTIFGATEEDMDKMRIVSLYDVDLEKVFAQGKVDDDEAKTEGGEPRTSQ